MLEQWPVADVLQSLNFKAVRQRKFVKLGGEAVGEE